MTDTTAQAGGLAGGLEGLRVMVIDDSKTIRRTAETLLKRGHSERVVRKIMGENWVNVLKDVWGE